MFITYCAECGNKVGLNKVRISGLLQIVLIILFFSYEIISDMEHAFWYLDLFFLCSGLMMLFNRSIKKKYCSKCRMISDR